MILLPGVLAAAEEVQQVCQQQDWQFCFIGGVAVQRWGEPRLTQDVDLTLLAGFGSEEAYVDTCLPDCGRGAVMLVSLPSNIECYWSGPTAEWIWILL
jgi:hypothetical protein